MIPMLAFYLTVLLLIACIWYGGYDGTMRLVAYADLQLRYAWVQIRMFFMRQRLKRDLKQAGMDYEKLFKETRDAKR